MKRVICNQCRVESPMDSYGLPPRAWYAISSPFKTGERYIDVHVCSSECLHAWAADELSLTKKDSTAEREGLPPGTSQLVGYVEPSMRGVVEPDPRD